MPPAQITVATITQQEFIAVQRLIYKIAGISLSDAKQVLLVGRLSKRLKQYGLSTFAEYYRMLASGDNPRRTADDGGSADHQRNLLLPRADALRFPAQRIVAKRNNPATFRVWSAASSSGEEAYSIAMTLAKPFRPARGEIVGSDISTKVLAAAAAGHYSLARTDGIPPGYMRKYCLKGVRSHAGTFLIARNCAKGRFFQINLMHPVEADIGDFDVIFLRNVMIYFDPETKTRVVLTCSRG